jgi:hypothetical protein
MVRSERATEYAITYIYANLFTPVFSSLPAPSACWGNFDESISLQEELERAVHTLQEWVFDEVSAAR